MPYIKSDRRAELFETYFHREDRIDYKIAEGATIKDAGELNFVLTKLCQEYFTRNGGRYQQINDIIGALEGCKLEFYRRLVGLYEDRKIVENGDVY